VAAPRWPTAPGSASCPPAPWPCLPGRRRQFMSSCPASGRIRSCGSRNCRLTWNWLRRTAGLARCADRACPARSSAANRMGCGAVRSWSRGRSSPRSGHVAASRHAQRDHLRPRAAGSVPDRAPLPVRYREIFLNGPWCPPGPCAGWTGGALGHLRLPVRGSGPARGPGQPPRCGWPRRAGCTGGHQRRTVRLVTHSN
jgi:hypothetical protein